MLSNDWSPAQAKVIANAFRERNGICSLCGHEKNVLESTGEAIKQSALGALRWTGCDMILLAAESERMRLTELDLTKTNMDHILPYSWRTIYGANICDMHDDHLVIEIFEAQHHGRRTTGWRYTQDMGRDCGRHSYALPATKTCKLLDLAPWLALVELQKRLQKLLWPQEQSISLSCWPKVGTFLQGLGVQIHITADRPPKPPGILTRDTDSGPVVRRPAVIAEPGLEPEFWKEPLPPYWVGSQYLAFVKDVECPKRDWVHADLGNDEIEIGCTRMRAYEARIAKLEAAAPSWVQPR